jgi:hypothetical protein
MPGIVVVRQMSQHFDEVATAFDELRATMTTQPADGKERPVSFAHRLETRYYDVGDLPAEDLVQAIPQFVGGTNSWSVNGGRGAVQVVGEMLAVRHFPAMQAQVRQFLRTAKRDAIKPQGPMGMMGTAIMGTGPCFHFSMQKQPQSAEQGD